MMRLRKWIPLLVLAACVLTFVGYRSFDHARTDTKGPQITVDESQQLQLSVSDPEQMLLQGVSAQDDRDGDVSDLTVVESVSTVSPEGTVTVTYAAFDRSGNVTKAQRQVCYTDYESPRITLSQALVFTYGTGFDVLDAVGAWDGLDGDLSYRVKATSLDETAITAEGTHKVQFRVTNSLGETVTQELPVEVCPVGRFDAQLTLTEYLVYIRQGEDIEPKDYLNLFTTNEDTTNLSRGDSSDVRVRTVGRVNTNEPGVYTVAFYASQTTERNTYTGYTKLIVIVEE